MNNPKNYAISSAAADLGLGDQLTQQLADQEDERKKKLMTAGKGALPSAYGDGVMGLASMNLLGV